MMRLNARWKVAGIAAVAGLLGVIVPMQLATGTVQTGLAFPDKGVLHLHFGTDGNYFQRIKAGEAALTENITTSGCTATVGANLSEPRLVNVTTNTGFIGAETAGDTTIGLGVRPAKGSGASGTPCGQVNPGESLSIELGSALPGLVFGSDQAGLVVDRAELDIDAKYRVSVRADFFIKNSQGQYVPSGPSQTLPTTGSDSGPDSTFRDNFAFLIENVVFTKIVLTPVIPPGGNSNGAFSLEGGRRGDPQAGLRIELSTYDTVFHLSEVTGVLNCGENSPTVGDSSTTPTSSLYRNPDSTCVPIPYSLQTAQQDGTGTVRLAKDLLGQTDANFTMTITWQPEAFPTEPVSDPHYGYSLKRWTTIDYDGDGPLPEHDVKWCEGTGATPALPTGELWCLTNQAIDLDLFSTGSVKVTETFFGSGDPVTRR